MALAVRAIEKGDVPEACALLNRIIEIGGTTAYETVFTHEDFVRSYIERAGLIACHVALDPGGRVAGFQSIATAPHLPGDCANIATFARVEPKVRGVGRALFPVTCRAARKAGCIAINATIRADNIFGLGYYSAMGFADHLVDRAVPLADGRKVDRISKRYRLD